MDQVTRPVRALLLLALLLAVAPSPGVTKEPCPWPCHCPQRERLDCRHSGLDTVPPASRRQPLAVLDFTGNSIAALGDHTWKEYPWTETLVLRDNELRTVKSHSLEGLFLLKHLDLSSNEIMSIEEQAFEPLPFLKVLNLSENSLMQIRSGTFQAWHGMQFLRELILNHNPLAVIADTAFFKLPSVSSLDLSATQVTPQTLLLLLQTTLSLETLQVPKVVACCLCQKRPLPESPCRSIHFLCEKLCSTSSPQCAHTSVVQTRGEIVDVEQPRTLSTSPALSLKPKEPSLGDDRTVTLALALIQSTEDDVSRLDNSKTYSYPTQHLLGHKGKTNVDDLRTKVKKMLHKKKLHKSKSINTAKSILPYQPQHARLKFVVEKTPPSWDQQEMESQLKRHRLHPSDVGGGLYRAYHASITGQRRDEKEDPAPRKSYIRTHKWHRKEDSKNWAGQTPLFYQVWRPVKKEPKARADQGLNWNLDFLSDPLVQSRPGARSWGETTAEEEHSSLVRHPLISPDTREQKGSMLLNKPGSLRSPDFLPVPEELLETTPDDDQEVLEPDKGLETFMTHVEQALRMDCSLPQLKQACAKMVSKTRLLLNLLSERQENQGTSDHMDQCRLQENMIVHMAVGKGKKLTGKKLEAVVYVITCVVLLSFFIIVFLILKCVCQKRSRPCEHDCQPNHSRTLCLRRCCKQRGRKDDQEAQDVVQHWAESSSESCPCPDTVYGASQCRAPFKKSELSWIQRIRRVYEAQK